MLTPEVSETIIVSIVVPFWVTLTLAKLRLDQNFKELQRRLRGTVLRSVELLGRVVFCADCWGASNDVKDSPRRNLRYSSIEALHRKRYTS